MLIIFPTKTCVLPPDLFGLFIFFFILQEKSTSFSFCQECLIQAPLLTPDWWELVAVFRELEALHPLVSHWQHWLQTVSNTSHTESPSARGICNTFHLTPYNTLRCHLDKMKIREREESGESGVSDDGLCRATPINHKLSSLA